MNSVEILIEDSGKTNDHQTRIIIDGEDYLGCRLLGIDPPKFFEQVLGGSFFLSCGLPKDDMDLKFMRKR